MAACTPPGLVRHAGGAQAHLHAAERADQLQVAEIAEMADAEHAVLQNAETVAEAHVEPVQDGGPQFVGAVAFRHADRGERGGVVPRFERIGFRAPRRVRRAAWPRRSGRGGRTRCPSLPPAASSPLRSGRRAGWCRACRGSSRFRWPPAWRASPSSCAAVWLISAARSALALMALKLRPGGSIRPFCEPATVTSTPHSSWR